MDVRQETESITIGGDTSTDEGKLSGQQTPPVVEERANEIKLNSDQLRERLERAKATERERLFKELGFEDSATLKAAIEAGQKALDAQKSDQERAAEELRKAQEKSQALEAQARQAEERAQAALLQTEAYALMAGRFANPRAAIRLLDLTAVKVDDGKITGLDEAVEKLAKDEPWTLAQPARKTPAQPNLTTNPQGDADPGKESEAEKRARYFGNMGGGAEFFKGGGVRVRPK